MEETPLITSISIFKLQYLRMILFPIGELRSFIVTAPLVSHTFFMIPIDEDYHHPSPLNQNYADLLPRCHLTFQASSLACLVSSSFPPFRSLFSDPCLLSRDLDLDRFRCLDLRSSECLGDFLLLLCRLASVDLDLDLLLSWRFDFSSLLLSSLLLEWCFSVGGDLDLDLELDALEKTSITYLDFSSSSLLSVTSPSAFSFLLISAALAAASSVAVFMVAARLAASCCIIKGKEEEVVDEFRMAGFGGSCLAISTFNGRPPTSILFNAKAAVASSGFEYSISGLRLLTCTVFLRELAFVSFSADQQETNKVLKTHLHLKLMMRDNVEKSTSAEENREWATHNWLPIALHINHIISSAGNHIGHTIRPIIHILDNPLLLGAANSHSRSNLNLNLRPTVEQFATVCVLGNNRERGGSAGRPASDARAGRRALVGVQGADRLLGQPLFVLLFLVITIRSCGSSYG
nr:hypothetical protein Iba_chr12fCG7760 [Ipomoea batatas]